MVPSSINKSCLGFFIAYEEPHPNIKQEFIGRSDLLEVIHKYH